jgi:hypothetical protein
LDSQDTGLDMLAEMANGAGILALPAYDLHELHELAVLLSRSGLARFFRLFLGNYQLIFNTYTLCKESKKNMLLLFDWAT